MEPFLQLQVYEHFLVWDECTMCMEQEEVFEALDQYLHKVILKIKKNCCASGMLEKQNHDSGIKYERSVRTPSGSTTVCLTSCECVTSCMACSG